MNLTTNFVRTDYNPAIESFIKALIEKTFKDYHNVNSIVVNLYAQNDVMVPWKCNIHVSNLDGTLISTESLAANYLTAFSQALTRVKRQFEKIAS